MLALIMKGNVQLLGGSFYGNLALGTLKQLYIAAVDGQAVNLLLPVWLQESKLKNAYIGSVAYP